MSRNERTLRAAYRAELKAIRAGMRAAAQAKTWGRAAIKAGQVAEKAFSRAVALRRLVEDRTAAAKREKKKAKMAKDWYKRPGRAA